MDPKDRDQKVVQEETAERRPGDGGEGRKFPEPHAWALEWDGFVLSKAEGEQSGHTSSSTFKSR